jgi:transcriptional regulator with XRE-family HTH domain
MKSRLQQFLEVEQLSPARLSEIMGIQRSGLSHILSGRNKPGFDFIQKLLVKFPALNAEWLITGKGKMYKDQNRSEKFLGLDEPNIGTSDLFADNEDDSTLIDESELIENRVNASTMDSGGKKRSLKRVLLIYSDNSFEDITPGKIV